MLLRRCCLGLAVMLGLIIQHQAYSWNALGHRLVAQIAYHHLTDRSKSLYNRYNRSLNSVYRAQTLVNAAPWMDGLRYKNELWLQPMHYIDIPFSIDGTTLIQPDKVNAVYAINEASLVLKDSYTNAFNKGFSLRILLHVVGDLHQPMHAVSQFSVKHPEGDYGGNLVFLGKNTVAKNLHAYWDNGGGFLKTRHYLSNRALDAKAYKIESRWPCNLGAMTINPNAWSKESHELAVSKAYLIKNGQKPEKNYQKMVKEITRQRIALAGCRLAFLLNTLSENKEG